MKRTVFALFDDVLAAQRVAAALERENFESGAISLLAPDPRGRYAVPGPAGAARRFTPYDLRGLGPSAVAGPLTSVIGGAGSLGGGLVEALTSIGFPDPEARHYFESLRRGQALIAVESSEDRLPDAVELMRRLGARAVDETGFHQDVEPAPAPPAARPVVEPAPLQDELTVPVVEEHLEIGKRQVSRGGIRVHSHIVEEPVQENISLREERLVVERRTVYRDATEEDLSDFKEGVIEIHETVEEPVITKRRRVVEEVVIGREIRERTATISETVRKTQVDVEQLGPDGGDDTAARYGAALARDERYRNSPWDEVEPHARREWETQNAGTWDQVQEAIRNAWHKVSGH